MISRESLAAFRDRLGSDGVVEHAPVDVDGQEVTATIRPEDGASLARALETFGSLELGALVRGGGHRFGVGNPPARASAFLSTARLRGVECFEPSEGVCRVLAGTPLAELRARVQRDGWEVPLDPPGENSTVGGTLAAAAVGPRAHGYGLPRDVVLGLDVVLATGERTRCGGRVVKNVTGYDLAKLYTGSYGTLAVIEASWLRLRPAPQLVRCLEASVSGDAAACSAALASARRESSRAASLAGGGPDRARGEYKITVEFAGDRPTVARDADWFASELGAVAAPDDAIDTLRDHQGELPGPLGLRFRIAALPSRFAQLLESLHAAGAETLSHPGLRLVYAGFPLPEAGAQPLADRIFGGVAAAVEAAGGSSVCEAAPGWAKAGREMHGEVAALMPLFRALKTRFDPGNVLNPGRFAGGL